MNTSTRSNPQQIGKLAMQHVEQELSRRGAQVRRITAQRKNLLVASSPDGAREVTIRVKSRTAGTFQVRTTEGRTGDEPPEVKDFWILVDFSVSMNNPDFYIMPDWWFRNDIYVKHREWLASHGGVRPETPGSDHHAVATHRVEAWKDRWDILGIFLKT